MDSYADLFCFGNTMYLPSGAYLRGRFLGRSSVPARSLSGHSALGVATLTTAYRQPSKNGFWALPIEGKAVSSRGTKLQIFSCLITSLQATLLVRSHAVSEMGSSLIHFTGICSLGGLSPKALLYNHQHRVVFASLF